MPPEIPSNFQEMQGPLEQAEHHHMGAIIKIQMVGNSTRQMSRFLNRKNGSIKKIEVA